MAIRRVFLDIGAYEGETVEAVIGMGFDQVYAFEPMPTQFAELARRFGNRPDVTLLNYGLSDMTCDRPVYGSNEHYEASVYPEAPQIDDQIVTRCSFVKATDWFRDNLEPGDRVVAKVNCEGSEVDILDDLIESGEIWTLEAVTICFDINRFEGREHRETQTRNSLATIGFDIPRWHLFGAAQGETHQDRIRDWLQSVPA